MNIVVPNLPFEMDGDEYILHKHQLGCYLQIRLESRWRVVHRFHVSLVTLEEVIDAINCRNAREVMDK